MLLWAGVFSILYAGRLLLENQLFRDAFNSSGNGYRPYSLCITYLINIPFTLFIRELLGRGWKGTIDFWLRLSVSLAFIAIPCTFFASQPHWIDLTNSVLVVSGTVLALLHVLMARRTGNPLAASLLWPLLIFGALIVLQN